MIIRMIIISLVALSQAPSPSPYSASRMPSQQSTQTIQAHIQHSLSAHSPKALRIFIEEDFATAQMLKRELTYQFGRISTPVFFVEKESDAYDFRILLASSVGSDSGSCTPPLVDASSTCSVSVSLHFVSAVGLTPNHKHQFTETGVGSTKKYAITNLARIMAKRLLFLTDTKRKTTT